MAKRSLAGGLRLTVLAVAILAAGVIAPARAAEPGTQGRIIGGAPITVQQAPWSVAVALNDAVWAGTSKERFACGGALVAPTVVVTAAHCLYDRPVTGGFNAPSQFEVYAGRTTLSSTEGQVVDVSAVGYLAKGPSGRPVLEVLGGPDRGRDLYSPRALHWDVAVLVLASPVTVAAPVQIAGPGEERTWSAHRRALISGWGAVAQSGPFDASDGLQATRVSLLSDRKCRRVYSRLVSARSELCTSTSPGGGRGHCFGDSGGPLVVPVKAGGTRTWRLAGVISAGGTERKCAPGSRPDVYERVAGRPTRRALDKAFRQFGIDLVGRGARPR